MAIRIGNNGPNTINFRNLGVSNDKGYGQGGNDKLYGGDGNDKLYGGDGNDQVSGDAGNDFLNGGRGHDKLYGGEGNDKLYGGDGNDEAYGNAGNDFLYGGRGSDKLSGGAGDDYLSGAKGNDKLYGGDGDDDLHGGSGYDVLEGGAGQDDHTGGGDIFQRDDFVFTIFESNSTNAGADVITDWSVADRIRTNIAGTGTNYDEHSTSSVDVATATQHANDFHSGKNYVFLWNAAQDKGYLLADLNSSGAFETAIVLNGAGSGADFDWTNIIV